MVYIVVLSVEAILTAVNNIPFHLTLKNLIKYVASRQNAIPVTIGFILKVTTGSYLQSRRYLDSSIVRAVRQVIAAHRWLSDINTVLELFLFSSSVKKLSDLKSDWETFFSVGRFHHRICDRGQCFSCSTPVGWSNSPLSITCSTHSWSVMKYSWKTYVKFVSIH